MSEVAMELRTQTPESMQVRDMAHYNGLYAVDTLYGEKLSPNTLSVMYTEEEWMINSTEKFSITCLYGAFSLSQYAWKIMAASPGTFSIL